MYVFLLTLTTPGGILAVSILIYSIVIAIVCPKIKKNGSKKAAVVLCLLPLLAALVHFAIYGISAALDFLYLYGLAFLPVINLLPGKKKLPAVLKAAVSSLAAVAVCFLFLINSMCRPVHSFTRLSYTESFKKMLQTMQKEYCLNSWKKIDYGYLLNEYLPRVEEAEKNKDENAYAQVVTEVTYRFYDSHVYAQLGDETHEQVMNNLAGNDYGLSLIKLDDGKVIAILVESERGLIYDEPHDLGKLGIHDGTQITSWDGKKIDEAIDETECINPMIQFAVKSNEDFFRPAFLAGKGGETVDITFIDDNGSEKHATLNKLGDYSSRLTGAIMLFLQPRTHDPNFTTKMLTDKCGYLLVRAEHFSTFADNLAVLRDGSYPELTEFYAGKIEELKAQGMEYLVIDIRNNVGGYDNVAGALASLFTSEKRHMFAFGFEDANGYHKRDDQYIYPDGRYKDLPVVVLVNSQCVSAGDGMAKFLSDCDNVTLMGLTASGGVNQNNGARIYLTDNISVYYPAFLTLSYEGVPLIDTDNTRQTRIPLDEKIPVTREFALRFCDPDNLRNPGADDPQLDYAVDFLARKQASGN